MVQGVDAVLAVGVAAVVAWRAWWWAGIRCLPQAGVSQPWLLSAGNQLNVACITPTTAPTPSSSCCSHERVQGAGRCRADHPPGAHVLPSAPLAFGLGPMKPVCWLQPACCSLGTGFPDPSLCPALPLPNDNKCVPRCPPCRPSARRARSACGSCCRTQATASTVREPCRERCRAIATAMHVECVNSCPSLRCQQVGCVAAAGKAARHDQSGSACCPC